jgi:saccharopine dehydrogenase (NAD+, L-lysine-forming)
MDVMAIDNLPSMLPLESSQDYAGQLLPTLAELQTDLHGVWARAEALFAQHVQAVGPS